jgi:hypothetical protein
MFGSLNHGLAQWFSTSPSQSILLAPKGITFAPSVEFLGVLGAAAATLAVCTTVLNAADEKGFEKALLGHIMWSAFHCSTYAELSDYKSEQERLHLVGLNAGRTFLEG